MKAPLPRPHLRLCGVLGPAAAAARGAWPPPPRPPPARDDEAGVHLVARRWRGGGRRACMRMSMYT